MKHTKQATNSLSIQTVSEYGNSSDPNSPIDRGSICSTASLTPSSATLSTDFNFSEATIGINSSGFITIQSEHKRDDQEGHIHYSGRVLMPYAPNEENRPALSKKRRQHLNRIEAQFGSIVNGSSEIESKTEDEAPTYLLDSEEREIAFLEKGPFYFSPWTSMNPRDYKVFTEAHGHPSTKVFVMASCLFGAALAGKDRFGNFYPLIDHHLKVKNKVKEVVVDHNLHPYELMVFAAFEKLLPEMARMTGENEFKIRYHIPSLDYIMYGLHLCISGLMSFKAFGSYIEEVIHRGNVHKAILSKLAKNAEAEIEVVSPFDNLFENPSVITQDDIFSLFEINENKLLQHNELGEALYELGEELNEVIKDHASEMDESPSYELSHIIRILNGMDIGRQKSKDEEYVSSTKNYRDLCVILCIEDILNALTNNNFVPELREAWKSIIDAEPDLPKSPFDKLLHVGNISVIASASMREDIGPFEVCSLLPADERPIAACYRNVLGRHLSKDTYSFEHISCLNWVPLVLNYMENCDNTSNPNNQHNLFRLRTDLFDIDTEALESSLTQLLGLNPQFWYDIEDIRVAEYEESSAESTDGLDQEVSDIDQNEDSIHPYSSDRSCHSCPTYPPTHSGFFEKSSVGRDAALVLKDVPSNVSSMR